MVLNGLGTRGRLLKASTLTDYSEFFQNTKFHEKMWQGRVNDTF